jgi:hypothetical protein
MIFHNAAIFDDDEMGQKPNRACGSLGRAGMRDKRCQRRRARYNRTFSISILIMLQTGRRIG